MAAFHQECMETTRVENNRIFKLLKIILTYLCSNTMKCKPFFFFFFFFY